MSSCQSGLRPPVDVLAFHVHGGVEVPQPAPDVVPLPPPVPHSPSTPPEIIEPPLPEPRPPVRDPIVPDEIRLRRSLRAFARC